MILRTFRMLLSARLAAKSSIRLRNQLKDIIVGDATGLSVAIAVIRRKDCVKVSLIFTLYAIPVIS